MRIQFSDPLGPGSPAWEHSSKAIAAWRAWNVIPNLPERRVERTRAYRRYANFQHEMVRALRRQRQSPDQIREWVAFVHRARSDSELE